ncbi:peptide deformylase [Catenovulum sp. SM1970]|uniref:peptide deformylase n=1 Tax=Marinifaba aquimaris TaxID=2741323 RepID=UPI001572327E|nr:peptide deformylase [Marinifaba aquimaris]NTS78080.1 peptide deformylase [Marinifaba aquimaris]
MKIAQVGEQVLKTPAQEVTDFTDKSLISFSESLLQTMLEANGIGIAAPQVFDHRAIMYIASKSNPRYPDAPNMEPLLMINPKILELSGATEKAWEGCLSVPGIRGLVSRQTQVKISYQDIKGHVHLAEWFGFLARIFLHEFDHLIGKTWLDRIESNADIMAESVWLEKMQNGQL